MHLRQPPKGTICQLADVVSLKLQHLQAIEPLERETLNQPNPIPIQVPMEMKPSGQSIPPMYTSRLHHSQKFKQVFESLGKLWGSLHRETKGSLS